MRITCFTSPGSAQKDYARVTVQDEGMGIVPQAIPHIFDRFYRTDSSRARQTGGTGLGLSIARSLTELQGGTFELAVDGDLFKAVVTLPQSS